VSGIVGIVNLDGAPVDTNLLLAMTKFMAFRGPDGEGTWSAGGIGFGHTLLRVGPEASSEEQPASLDGKYWITADARIDGRAELIEKLRSEGSAVSIADPDHQLILHAYRVWGSACVEYLLGDFAFAIWNLETRKLFCARDHFGFKPFFYARIRNSFLFSNTLDCLRIHPEVSDKLNDAAVADFLLFDFNQDLRTTTFSDIQRLPPAHILECEAGKFSISRYWKLPESEPVYFKRPQECVDQFREVLDAAVSDRMRSNTACISLSGGLDSTAVAASARRILDRREAPSDLWSYTLVYNSLVPHEEGRLSDLVANALRIDATQYVADNGKLFGDFDQPDYRTPEPLHAPMGYSGVNPNPDIAARGRMLLTGMGADPLLASLRTRHLRRLIKAKQFGRLAKDLAGYFAAEGRFKRLYFRNHWDRLLGRSPEFEQFPAWLNPDLEKRLNLRERWTHANPIPQFNHSVRPEAHDAMNSPLWAGLFQVSDPGATRFPVEWRQPFFDIRVVKFLLALPALPWCVDKEILREAGRGILPDAVRLRRKSPLSADPIIMALQRPETAWVDHIEPDPRLSSYVVPSKIPRICGTEDTVISWVHLRPISLNFWLQRLRSVDYSSESHLDGGSS
jgi:asparagine synthase (glutamine-hydrolysing)